MITVAICTYNRADLLRKTLAQITKIDKPKSHDWELLVVNNNSTDCTEEVISEYSSILPLCRVLQPIQGLSNARNAAVENSHGDYIIWTDDDVLVSQQWLTSYEEGFERHPDAAVFGGPVTPWFEQEPPDWLTANWGLLANAYATRNLGIDELQLDISTGLIPFGANFCIRKKEQLLSPYNPNLGRNGSKSILGEETEVLKSIFNNGATGWWLPSASVRHWIPSQRMTLQYVRNYYRGLGRTQILISNTDNSVSVFGVPRWKIGRCLHEAYKYLSERSYLGMSRAIPSLCNLEEITGEIIEHYNLRHNTQK